MKKYFKILTKDFLIKEYIVNKKSMKSISESVGCTSMTVYYRLKKYNIKTRTSSEVLKGKNRPKHSEKMKGRKNPNVSKANKQRVGKRALNYIDGRCSEIYYCIEKDCNNKISYSNWKYGEKRCKSCSNKFNMLGNIPWNKNKKCPQFSGKNNPFYGKLIKPKWDKYKDINMRSSWEIKYAKYLDKQQINWQYESRTFDLGNTTYTPDFYLPETNEYIEIKGYSSDVFIKKFKLFKELYPKIKIEVLCKDELISMEVL